MKEVAMEGYRLRAALLLLLAFTLPGCGGGSSPENVAGTPDTGSTPPPAAPATPDPVTPDDDASAEPAPEDAPLEVKLITEGEISPLDPIVVGFDKSVDPESVGDTFVLRSLDAQSVIPLNADYSSADKTVTLTPGTPLAAGAHYVLDLDGIKALGSGEASSGKSSAPATMNKGTFKPLPPVISTRKNLIETSITYDDETGEITSYWVYSYHDEAGEGTIWLITDMYTGPGDDGDWSVTEDNDRVGSFVTELLTGKSYLKTWYTSPGKIGGWSPGNGDEIHRHALYEDSGLPGVESYVESMSIGSDGNWFTKDDVYNVVHIRRFDPATRTLLYVFGNSLVDDFGPGDDGEWVTPDDRIERYQRHYYDDDLRLQRVEEFRRSADDGDWYSDEDRQVARTDYEYDESGRLAGIDYGSSYYEYVYEGDARQFAYSIRRTSRDGEMFNYLMRRNSESGDVLDRGVFSGKGLDDLWFTEDDPSSNFSRSLLNEDGLERLRWNYDGLGDDGLRYSGDETVNSLTIYEYNEKGHLVASDYFTHPGDDDTWNTPGDRKTFRFTYLRKPVSETD
jgi:hypothetical protein